MTDSVSYILIAMTMASLAIGIVFLLAWKYLGREPHALTWAIGYLVGAVQWSLNLFWDLFPSIIAFRLTLSAIALIICTLGLRGHCQRTNCSFMPGNLWWYAVLLYLPIVWTIAVRPHVGISVALIPATAALALILAGIIILRFRDKPRPAEWAAAIASLVFGASQVIAAGVALKMGPNGDAHYYALYIHLAYLFLPAGYTTVAMFTAFMVASDLSEQMKALAVMDTLTGLYNRRGFSQQAEQAFSLARRSGGPVSIIMTDIDHFKRINDRYGHAVGDEALQHFATLLVTDRRTEDVVARMGGEEFAIVLPNADLFQAVKVAERIRANVEAHPLEMGGHEIPMTSSFGVASLSDNDDDVHTILMRADKALYRSKDRGRNRVDLESSQKLVCIDGELHAPDGYGQAVRRSQRG